MNRRVKSAGSEAPAPTASELADTLVTEYWNDSAPYTPGAGQSSKRELERRGRDEGQRGIPELLEPELTGAQREIADHVAAEHEKYQADFDRHAAAVRRGLSQIAVQPLVQGTRSDPGLEQDVKSMEKEVDGFWRSLVGDYTEADRRAMAAERSLRVFKHDHNRKGPAVYPQSLWMFWVTVAVLLVVEGFVNGAVFQQVMPGLVNAVVLAVMFGLINILLGFGFGWVGWRNIIHVTPARKAIGWLTSAGLLCAGVFWNFFVAHFREVAESGDREAMRSAVAHLRDAPLNIQSGEGLGLLLFGLAIFFYMAWKGYRKLTDPYIGYKQEDVEYHNASEDVDAMRAAVHENITEHAERCRKAVKAKADSCEANALAARRLVDYLIKRRTDLERSAAMSVQVGNQRLDDYRRANMKIRGGRSPVSFGERLLEQDYKVSGDEAHKDLSKRQREIIENAQNNAPVYQQFQLDISDHEARLHELAEARFKAVRERNEERENVSAASEDDAVQDRPDAGAAPELRTGVA